MLKKHAAILLMLMAFMSVAFLFSQMPVPPDWATFGHLWRADPYELPGFFNPPWVALALAPLEILGERAGVLVWRLASLAAMLLAARHFGVSGWQLLPFILSPAFWAVIWNGQLDGVALFLLSLEGIPGLYGASVKPQSGWGAALYYLRTGRWKEIAWLGCGVLLSFAIWGWWPGRMQLQHLYRGMDVVGKYQPWPALVGLPVVAWGLLKKRYDLAIYGAPLCAPYGMLHSLVGPALGLAACFPVYISLPLALAAWPVLIFSGGR